MSTIKWRKKWLRIALKHCYPVNIMLSTSHWVPNGTQHGKKSNPKLLAVSLINLPSVCSPSTGHRLWIYIRGGYAFCVDLFIDRRGDHSFSDEMVDKYTRDDEACRDQAIVDAMEAAFIAGFEAGQRHKPEEWLTDWTNYTTKGIVATDSYPVV